MAEVTDATAAWSAGVTLSADEIWQVHTGSIMIETGGSPPSAGAAGLRMSENPRESSVKISSGVTVYYRLAGGTAATFVRVAV